jgi:hypothetical protein
MTRRPSFGPRIMNGLYLIWRKTEYNIRNGYVPFEWSSRDHQDVRRAMRWLARFIDWEDSRKEEEDASAETDAS